MGEGNRLIAEVKALESASTSSESVSSAVPAGLEFAFWGHEAGAPGAAIAAFRVTVAGDYSWADEGDISLVAGFDYSSTLADANLAAMEVGQYVLIVAEPILKPQQYADKVAAWGFDPAAALPGSWHFTPSPLTAEVTLSSPITGMLTNTNVQNALEELTARIVTLETP